MVRTRKNRPPTITIDSPFDVPSNPLDTVPPQSSLEPIGNTPFYMTPDEPASPLDCDRYPESLYCGQPFTNTPIGIEPEIVSDECNLGIQLTPTFGFIILPPVQIVYRRPDCRKLEIKEPVAPKDPGYEYIPVDVPTTRGCVYSVKVAVDYSRTTYNFQTGQYETRSYKYPNDTATEHSVYVWGEIFGLRTQVSMRTVFDRVTGITHTYSRASAAVIAKVDADTDEGVGGEFLNFSNVAIGLYNLGDRYPYLKRVSRLSKTLSPGYWEASGIFSIEDYVTAGWQPPRWRIISIQELWCDRSALAISPPPLPPQPHCNCPMTCCPSTTQNDQLLRMLIKKVDKLSEIVGVNEYPAELPSSLISKDEGFLGNLIPNAPTRIPNLTRFLAWYVERFDEIMGQWEIPIEVKDSDPTKPGDQPVGFKLPNMAEAIAEMFGLMLQTSINSETLLNMNTRALLEGGQIKQQSFKTYMMAQAIVDHLGFQYEETKHKIPMLFKVGEEELDKLLQESTLEVTAIEHTDTSDLKTTLNDLLQAAAIIRAVHFRQFDPKQDVKQQFKNLINNLVAAGDKVNNQQTDSAGKDDFDRFVEDAETGFTQYPGASDPTHPYGRDYSERPKIREISIDTSDSNP